MRSSELKKELMFAVLMVIISVAILFQAYGYAADSSQFPRFLAWSLMVLSILNILRMIKLKSQEDSKAHSALWPNRWLVLSVLVLASVFLYTLASPFIGYYLSTVIFLVGFMGLYGRSCGIGWRGIVLACVIFLGTVYLMFSVFLGTQLPMGSLFEGFWG